MLFLRIFQNTCSGVEYCDSDSTFDRISMSKETGLGEFQGERRLSMLFAYGYDKVAHFQDCIYFKKIPKHARRWASSFEELASCGCWQCAICSPMAKYIQKEKTQLKPFCVRNGIDYWFNARTGTLDIETNSGGWKIAVQGNKKKIWLYHKNTYDKLSPDSPYRGYHPQEFHCQTLMEYMKYIASHDKFREQNPLPGSETPQRQHRSFWSKPDEVVTVLENYGEDDYKKNYLLVETGKEDWEESPLSPQGGRTCKRTII